MKPSEYLLRAILEDPADDLARLAYADALEEEGDTTGQAELIRGNTNDFEYPYLRYAESLAAVFDAKARIRMANPSISMMYGKESIMLMYGKDHKKICAILNTRSGFVDSVEATNLGWWQKHAPKLCLLHPVEKVKGLVAEGYRWNRCGPVCRQADAWHWRDADIRDDRMFDEPLREFLCVRLTQRFYANADEARADFNAACLEWAKPEWLRPKPKRSSNAAAANYASAFSALSLFRSRADHMPVFLDPRRIIRGTT